MWEVGGLHASDAPSEKNPDILFTLEKMCHYETGWMAQKIHADITENITLLLLHYASSKNIIIHIISSPVTSNG